MEVSIKTQNFNTWSRREFLRGLSIAAGAGLLGLRPELAAAEPPPETTTIRLIRPEAAVLCYAPQFVAEQFLHLEGFTDIRHVPYLPGSEAETLVANTADISSTFGVNWVTAIDREAPVIVVAGLHAGCVEIFVNDQIHSIRELKNKRIAVSGLDTGTHTFLSSVAAYIGLDPNRDIEWVVSTNPNDWARLLASGEVDAIGTFPPMSYEQHARRIGHVILNTTTDEPWRHYFCCMVAARREFVQNYPIATKRALRAILKANQLCSLEPERTAQWLVGKGFASNYSYALRTLQDVRYGAWRDYDPEDTLRFYSLRLREAGMIQQTPQEIIDQGTDWRFLDELKQELKA